MATPVLPQPADLADYADALVRSTKDNTPQPEAGDPFAEELK